MFLVRFDLRNVQTKKTFLEAIINTITNLLNKNLFSSLFFFNHKNKINV